MRHNKQQAAQAVQKSFTTAVTDLHYVLGMSSKLNHPNASPMLTACVTFWLQAFREQSVFKCHTQSPEMRSKASSAVQANCLQSVASLQVLSRPQTSLCCYTFVVEHCATTITNCSCKHTILGSLCTRSSVKKHVPLCLQICWQG